MPEDIEQFYCSAETYRQTLYQPAEHCETEVDNEGDLCSAHEYEQDGPDPDDARDAWLESRYDDRYDD